MLIWTIYLLEWNVLICREKVKILKDTQQKSKQKEEDRKEEERKEEERKEKERKEEELTQKAVKSKTKLVLILILYSMAEINRLQHTYSY